MRAALVSVIIVIATRAATSVRAQAPGPAPDETPRWRATVAAGFLTGLESGLSIAELTYVVDEVVQFVVGHVTLYPTTPGARATSLTRIGSVWVVRRGRVTVDDRLLIERVSNRATGVSARARNRLRISWRPRKDLGVGVFASTEALVSTDSGATEYRVQAGASRSVGPFLGEVSWLRTGAGARPMRDNLLALAYWRFAR